MNVKEIEDKYSTGVYPKRPIQLVKGKGAKLFDSEGKEYIDCIGGIGSANVGHGNDWLGKAVQEQINELNVCNEIFYSEPRAKLLEKLAEITPKPLGKSFLCNSGTEAVEAAFKFSRLLTKKKKILASMNSFHGRTFGALSATWKPKYREPFEPLVPGFGFAPYNNSEKFLEKIDEDTAAVILEVIQGEGGVIPAKKEFLKEVQEKCRKTGSMLIIDEIQTGFGRTGKMFATEHYGLEPDMMTIAKSMGGGLPIGACVIREDIEIPKLLHGTTFGGNPAMCSASLASIDYIEKNDLVKKSEENGKYFLEKLKGLEENPKVREARGVGLMLGLELKEKPGPYLMQLAQKGLLLLPAGNTVLRFLPPLVIEKEEIDKAVQIVGEVLG